MLVSQQANQAAMAYCGCVELHRVQAAHQSCSLPPWWCKHSQHALGCARLLLTLCAAAATRVVLQVAKGGGGTSP
jgi:hypothetical protein